MRKQTEVWIVSHAEVQWYRTNNQKCLQYIFIVWSRFPINIIFVSFDFHIWFYSFSFLFLFVCFQLIWARGSYELFWSKLVRCRSASSAIASSSSLTILSLSSIFASSTQESGPISTKHRKSAHWFMEFKFL